MEDIEFPQVTGFETYVMAKVKYPDGYETESKLLTVDEFFNDTAFSFIAICIVLKSGKCVYGSYCKTIDEDGKYYVVLRSTINDSCLVNIPIDDIIGYVELTEWSQHGQ